MIIGMIFVRKQYKINFVYTPILKYLGATISASIIVYYISEKVLVYTESIFDFLPDFIPYLIAGIGLYLGITYLIDKKTKQLFHKIINEIRNH